MLYIEMAFMLIKNYASIQEMHQIREKKTMVSSMPIVIVGTYYHNS